MPDISSFKLHAEHLNRALEQLLAAKRGAVTTALWQAMHYSLMAGGKRVRPALILECYHACGGSDVESVMPAAMSIECMHTYSLIHDDLPCMDDDDLRRGMATSHKRFDEATAILTADALQALGFELVADLKYDAKTCVELLKRLAVASGAEGMVGGQVMDMQAGHDNININASENSLLAVERIHLHKTGALLRYCCEAGALLAGADDKKLAACSRYGKAVGLLFQIADDILDATATSDMLGKSAGKDEAQNKATYVSLLGLERARELAEDTRDIALEALLPLGESGAGLEALTHYIFRRNR